MSGCDDHAVSRLSLNEGCTWTNVSTIRGNIVTRYARWQTEIELTANLSTRCQKADASIMNNEAELFRQEMRLEEGTWSPGRRF